MDDGVRQGCANLPGEPAHREVAMIGEEQWKEVHRLFTVERWSKSAIARELDLDVKTVRRCLRHAAWVPYQRAPRPETVLTAPAAFVQRRARAGARPVRDPPGPAEPDRLGPGGDPVPPGPGRAAYLRAHPGLLSSRLLPHLSRRAAPHVPRRPRTGLRLLRGAYAGAPLRSPPDRLSPHRGGGGR